MQCRHQLPQQQKQQQQPHPHHPTQTLLEEDEDCNQITQRLVTLERAVSSLRNPKQFEARVAQVEENGPDNYAIDLFCSLRRLEGRVASLEEVLSRLDSPASLAAQLPTCVLSSSVQSNANNRSFSPNIAAVLKAGRSNESIRPTPLDKKCLPKDISEIAHALNTAHGLVDAALPREHRYEQLVSSEHLQELADSGKPTSVTVPKMLNRRPSLPTSFHRPGATGQDDEANMSLGQTLARVNSCRFAPNDSMTRNIAPGEDMDFTKRNVGIIQRVPCMRKKCQLPPRCSFAEGTPVNPAWRSSWVDHSPRS